MNRLKRTIHCFHRRALRLGGVIAVAPLLALALALTGCRPPEPSPTPPPGFVENQKPESKGVKGGSFNKLFPNVGSEGYKLTYTQEKPGFAAADVSKDGKKLAQLSISDTQTNPEARVKFQGSAKKVAGYPAAPVGTQGTAVLVADRFQVQVRSLNPAFTAEDREAMIGKFKLGDLAATK